MRILFAHTVPSPGRDKWYEEIAASACEGLEVVCFPVTLSPPGPRLSWRELDWRWRKREKKLMEMYRRLQELAHSCDVLFLYNGANIHPEFLDCLRTFNVYCCFDDPESSDDLSKPVAAAFDAVFFGNIAARFQYEHWGCNKLAWLPVFTAPSDVPSLADGETILHSRRDVDISLVCEKNARRSRRLDMLTSAFPQAKCHGSGWSADRISDTDLRSLYARTRIGWNIHNSTGPINRRLFVLSGFGALQICDNKTGLGHIYELNKEAVGFNTIPEAIELTRYYLAHEDVRREIASAGWRRFWRDYHAGAIWSRIKEQLTEWISQNDVTRRKIPHALPSRTPLASITPYLSLLKEKGEAGTKKARILAAVLHSSTDGERAVPDDSVYREQSTAVYIENPEMRGFNMARDRLRKGEPFEWPNMLALNWAATSLIRDAKKIVDIGSGTAPFAHFASVDSTRTIHCFEEDDFARGWAEANRSHPNVSYFKVVEGNLSKEYDLLVCLDVFEHISDMHGFLTFCSRLAPRAIFSTPNRDVVRSVHDMGPPCYPPHVREFDPGEFYWILRQYYPHVALYHMPDVYVPWLSPMVLHTPGTPVIAECRMNENK